ncbi:hypothetical protein HMI56_001041 [Coelomomyces lativittatus]|nr:hypothetical protein HMI56_001041 [Coelomomyces lativittatus]
MSNFRNKKHKHSHSNKPQQQQQHQKSHPSQNNKQQQQHKNNNNNQGPKTTNQPKPQQQGKKPHQPHGQQNKNKNTQQQQQQQQKPQPQFQPKKNQPAKQQPPSQKEKPKENKKEEKQSTSEVQDVAENIDPGLIEVEEKIAKVEEEYESSLQKIWVSMQQKKRPLFQQRREYLKKMDGFWSTVLTSHPQLKRLFEDFDNEVLVSLTDLYVDFPEDPETFTITFDFKPNAFFTNTQLKVEVTEDDVTPMIKSTEIQWKQGKNPFEKPSVKSGNEKRKAHEYSGFFVLLTDSQGDVEERAMILKAIATDIFPDALEYYTHEMDSEDDDDEEFDMEEDDEDDEDEDDEGDDDEDEDEDGEDFEMDEDEDEDEDDDEDDE